MPWTPAVKTEVRGLWSLTAVPLCPLLRRRFPFLLGASTAGIPLAAAALGVMGSRSPEWVVVELWWAATCATEGSTHAGLVPFSRGGGWRPPWPALCCVPVLGVMVTSRKIVAELGTGSSSRQIRRPVNPSLLPAGVVIRELFPFTTPVRCAD